MSDRAGVRLFARNVGGFFVDTGTNTSKRATLEKEPWNSWYYNNGITVISDSAQIIPIESRNVLRVRNPQVIDGQQTTRMLHAEGKEDVAHAGAVGGGPGGQRGERPSGL